jgi:hypothetical protein
VDAAVDGLRLRREPLLAIGVGRGGTVAVTVESDRHLWKHWQVPDNRSAWFWSQVVIDTDFS